MSDSGASVAAIAGGTAGGVVGIAAIAIGVFFLLRARGAAVARDGAAPTTEKYEMTHASGEAENSWEGWEQCEGTTDIFWSDAHQLYYDATNNCYLDVDGYPVGN